jgi:hypothetical protein
LVNHFHGGFAPFAPEMVLRRNTLKCAISRHMAAQQNTPLFDNLVGELRKLERHFEAERLGSLKIDAQLKLDR